MGARDHRWLVPPLIVLLLLITSCYAADMNQLLPATHPCPSGPAPNVARNNCDYSGIIQITSDNDFLSLGFPGTGTPANPYLIEGLSDYILYVINTTAYFVVRNCGFVFASFWNVTYGAVTECSFHGEMYMFNCRGCNLTYDRFSDTPSGTCVQGCNNTEISHSLFTNNSYYGIQLYGSVNATVKDNTLRDSIIIVVVWSTQLASCGYVFENNTVNGKPLGFFHDQKNLYAEGDSYGQIILLNCSNTVIRGGVFQEIFHAVQVYFCRNCTIRGTMVSNSYRPVYLSQSKNCSLEDCRVQDCDMGLLVWQSDNIILRNNSASQCDYGVSLGYAEYCLMTDNSVTGCSYGMELYNSSNCTVVYNTLVYNGIGLVLDRYSKYNLIYGNRIGWNKWDNAQDEGWRNQWDDGISIGNAWSDYFGFGVYKINFDTFDHYPSVLRSPADYALGAFLLLAIAVSTGFLLLALFRKKEKPV